MKTLHTLAAVIALSGFSLLGIISQSKATTPQPIEHESLVTRELSNKSDLIPLPTSNLPGDVRFVRGHEYTLLVSRKDTINLTVTSDLGEPDIAIFVVRPDDTTEVIDQGSRGQEERFSEEASSKGEYRFVVYHIGNGGRYKLLLEHYNSSGKAVKAKESQADAVLEELQIFSVPCSAGLSYLKVDGVTRCFMPSNRYPAERSPYTYDAKTKALVGTFPTSKMTPKQEFLDLNTAIKEAPCGVGMGEIQYNKQRLLCTPAYPAGVYSWDPSSNEILPISEDHGSGEDDLPPNPEEEIWLP